MKQITTHSGAFHADEVTACALLHVFLPDDYEITRIAHQAAVPADSDFVIDIGRKYDGVTTFDHHQREESDPMFKLSSAGLIWKYIGLADKYPQLSSFIELVDQNDVGIRKALAFEYPRIIGAFNGNLIYDDKSQQLAFNRAMGVAITVLTSMKEHQDNMDATDEYLTERLANLSEWELTNSTIIFDEWIRGWEHFINGRDTPHLRAVTWPKLADSTEWNAQCIPSTPGEYGLHGAPFEADQSMTFVHSNGFFCVAPNASTMITYLSKG